MVDTMTDNNPRETRDKFRKIYNSIADGNLIDHGKRDLYAEFMRLRFPEHAEKKDQSYAREWAQRFRDGSHWNHMDLESTKAMIRAMTKPIDGTAARLNREAALEALEEVAE